MGVAFSGDNRQIVSGSRDRTIKLWNTLAECKYTITEDMHSDWVSSVVFSPSAKMPLIVSGGWDKLVKVWNPATASSARSLWVTRVSCTTRPSLLTDLFALLVARTALQCF